jgi:hypothetical protein
MTATPTLSPASLSIPPVCPTVAIPPTKIADSTELVHDDVDHTGNLDKALSACPNATLACMWAMVERHTNCFFRSSRAPAPSHSSQGKGEQAPGVAASAADDRHRTAHAGCARRLAVGGEQRAIERFGDGDVRRVVDAQVVAKGPDARHETDDKDAFYAQSRPPVERPLGSVATEVAPQHLDA